MHTSAVLAAAIVGAGAASPTVAWIGLRHLGVDDAGRWAMVLAAGLGAGGGAAAAIRDSPTGYLSLLALVIWSVGLTACAACDVATHRIPTALVRQAGVVTALLLILSGAFHHDWRPAAVAGLACVVAFGLAMIAWRFAGLGRGDTRLAALGGLGLGWSTAHSVGFGVMALCAVSLFQVTLTLARGGGRRTQIPYGLPIAIGCLVAAAAL